MEGEYRVAKRGLVAALFILSAAASLHAQDAPPPAPPADAAAVAPNGPFRHASRAAARADERSHMIRRLVQTAVILAAGYLLIAVLVGIVNRQVQDLKVRHLVRKSVSYLITVIVLLYVVFLWAQNIGTITLFLGVAGAGVALALQEVILCVAGWFDILLRRPFEVGDRIELGGIKGDVIDIHLLQTTLLEIGNWVESDQSTGRIVNVPNSAIFKRENFNYTRGFEFIWNEMKLLITYESDWRRAEEIMLAAARRFAEGLEKVAKRKIDAMTRRYVIRYDKLTPIVYLAIKESGVELTLRYLTEAKQRRSTQDALSREILEACAKEPRVSFAYPTYRIVK